MILGSAPVQEYNLQLSAKTWGYPSVSNPRETKELASTNTSANATLDATANTTANATADADANETANATANATKNATGNATKALEKEEIDYNSPAYVMPYAHSNDAAVEHPVNFDLKPKDKHRPYMARPAKYAVNYPMNNERRRFAPPLPEDD